MTFSPLQALDGLNLPEQILLSQVGRGLNTTSPFTLIHKAFERTADENPSGIAVEHDGRSLTYQELEANSNCLANRLIADGLRPRQRVCVVVQRSLPMVIAILAILKCGCQYTPLDGQVTPEAAMQHIFTDTQAPYVLCQEKFQQKVRPLVDASCTVLVLDEISEPAQAVSVRPNVDVSPTDGAYVIYTSGSTGLPKGVDITHGNVTNLLCNSPGNLGIQSGTLVAQLLSVSFDMGQWEILGTLINGGTLLIRTSDWNAVLKRVHTIISTPSILGTFPREEYPNIKVVAVAGEPCPQPLADEWSKQATFWNCCGPTEVTIVNTMHKHICGEKLSIGRPVPNTNVYILDEDERPIPFGETGLMWVGGAAVSRGYVNLPERTSKTYKFDKFSGIENSVMFNTGDLCHWRPDGTIAHDGRADDQVKIKGFRVELDSVSAAMEQTQGVTRACAVFSGKVLWGFYTGTQNIPWTVVKEAVEQSQPYYSVPSMFEFRDTLPMTLNGKVDKRSLLASVGVVPTPTPSEISVPPSALVRISEKPQFDLSVASTAASSTSGEFPKEYTLPDKKGRHGLRALRHRIFSLYRRLFTLVFIGNMIAVGAIFGYGRKGRGLQNISTAIAANLTMAVLMRQDYVINALFTIACSVPTSAPMWLRRNCAKIYHIGGLHSGCAVASTIWLVIFTITSTAMKAEPGVLFVSWLLVVLLICVASSAHPKIRMKYHDRFEMTHRFAGWSALALFWVQTVIVTDSVRGRTPLGLALARSPGFWLLGVATSSVILPWLHLRKVEIRSEVLSDHAVRIYLKHTTAIVGTAIRLSERPLIEWHAFATIAKPNEKEFSVLVSNAGDWTSKQIRTAPTKMWVRGIPACGVLRIAPLFKSIVLVATGSGIGPCLPVIYAKKVPARIFWSTPHPEKNFGSEIISAVEAADPNAVIHNTKTMGRPDMVAITYRLLRESGAEAVCIISNKKLTQMVVYAMESRGIPAFGAIFDS
ncbi:hypothetical protein BP6252_07258 [Coleophoma cylindrospora]|uniref:AMP-dependent synthetase/ligase domain-containing protein n=1 Tax=Coleophoma cylindrospora TaxID=1849047 RepID=A0A3D8RHN1_9HELO|nr:hypothetical protein BP6252_07258 [Coleophoma cylindrospora]